MIKQMFTASLVTITALAACSMQNLPPLPTRRAPPATSVTPSSESRSEAGTAANEDVVSREFAERLVGYYGFGSPETVEPEILVGKLPPDLSFLTFPKGTTLLGSVVRGDTGAEVILDSSQSPDAILAAFAEQLKAQGWTTTTVNPMGPGGFVPAKQRGNFFCKSEDGPMVFVNTRALKTGMTDVRLTYTTQRGLGFGYGPCRIPSGAMMGPPFQLPNLTPPQGVRQIGGSSGGSGPDRFWTSTMLVTTMTVSTIQDHYATQLEKANWVRDDTGSDGPMAWSRWTNKDAQGKAQNGLLFVLAEEGATPQRFVYLQVSSPNSRGGAVQNVAQLVRVAP